jgi:hypothetical protein
VAGELGPASALVGLAVGSPLLDARPDVSLGGDVEHLLAMLSRLFCLSIFPIPSACMLLPTLMPIEPSKPRSTPTPLVAAAASVIGAQSYDRVWVLADSRQRNVGWLCFARPKKQSAAHQKHLQHLGVQIIHTNVTLYSNEWKISHTRKGKTASIYK